MSYKNRQVKKGFRIRKIQYWKDSPWNGANFCFLGIKKLQMIGKNAITTLAKFAVSMRHLKTDLLLSAIIYIPSALAL